jgi:hypothetical protein
MENILVQELLGFFKYCSCFKNHSWEPTSGTGFNFESYSNELDKSFSSSQSVTSTFVDSERDAASTNSFYDYMCKWESNRFNFNNSAFKQTLITKNKKLLPWLLLFVGFSSINVYTFYFLFVSGVLKMMGLKQLTF